GATEGVEGQRLGDLEQLRPDAGGLEIGVGSTRLVGLTGSLELLANYPYACTEQVASRLLPALPLADIARAFGFEVNAGSTRDAGAAVGTLLKRQRSDGGFGFWPESPVSHPFVSAYTLWVLKLAQDRGQSISDAVFLRGAAYLRSLLNSSGAPDDMSPGVEQTLDARAFAAFVLATLGKPDPGAIERLIEERAALTTLGHAWLVMAAVEAKLGTNVRMPLVKHLESSITAVGNRAIVKDEGQQDEVPHGDVLLSSASKVQASVLSALLAHDANHPLAGKLVTELLAHREGGTW